MSGCSNRSLSRRRPAMLLVCLAFCLILSGCSAVPQDSSGLNSPIEIKYLVENPTQEVPIENNQQDFYYRCITITGLKDQEVQKKINDRLTEGFEALKAKDQPPYRGIKILIPEGSKKIGENISAYTSGSFNNILSVSISKYATYAVPDENGIIQEQAPGQYGNIWSYSEIECFNFDLNTGEEITLADVFADDVEYQNVLNPIMNEKLQKGQASEDGYYGMDLYNLKLVKPFDGIQEDQPFYLNNWGLMLVFDYRTPVFDTSLQASVLSMSWTELGDKVAITQRFYNEATDLYTSEEPVVKSLLNGNDRADKQVQSNEKVGLINVYTTANYASSYPKFVQDKILELSVRDEAEIQRMQDIMASKPQGFINQYGEGYYDLSVSAFAAGHYVTVVKNVFGSIPSPDNNGSVQQLEYYCYDRNTGREVTLLDLFVPGYDPVPIIKKAIEESINNNVLSYGAGLSISEEEKQKLLSDENIDRLYQGIQGVNVSASELYFSLPNVTLGNQTYMLTSYASYKTIGADNLTIFQ